MVALAWGIAGRDMNGGVDVEVGPKVARRGEKVAVLPLGGDESGGPSLCGEKRAVLPLCGSG